MTKEERRTAAVRRALGRSGLRVVCMGCGVTGRFWTGDRVEMVVPASPLGPVLGSAHRRLRETPCPRCHGRWLRGFHWVMTHPELAGEQRRKIVAARHSLGI